jgi:fructoselysine-6-P-deglycase FrlB-like protein
MPPSATVVSRPVGLPQSSAEAIFARQVIAYGRAGDVALSFSTSGNSANVIAALAEARRRGLMTVAMVGYDGGRVAAEGLADVVVPPRRRAGSPRRPGGRGPRRPPCQEASSRTGACWRA